MKIKLTELKKKLKNIKIIVAKLQTTIDANGGETIKNVESQIRMVEENLGKQKHEDEDK